MNDVPVMPVEYVGDFLKKTNMTVTIPRKWTENEIKWCVDLRKKGATIDQIAKSVGRNHDSVSIKIKRIMKKNGCYNASHAAEKREINKEFVDYINASTVLDVFSGGRNSSYAGLDVVSNDIDLSKDSDYHMDAYRFLCMMISEGRDKFDYVDLDPYGSAYDCIGMAVRMCRLGIAVTFGEMGHRRFRRYDFVKDRYGIEKYEDFSSMKMVDEVKRIGRINHVSLDLYRICDWGNISRAWFTVSPVKYVFHENPALI